MAPTGRDLARTTLPLVTGLGQRKSVDGTVVLYHYSAFHDELDAL